MILDELKSLAARLDVLGKRIQHEPETVLLYQCVRYQQAVNLVHQAALNLQRRLRLRHRALMEAQGQQQTPPYPANQSQSYSPPSAETLAEIDNTP